MEKFIQDITKRLEGINSRSYTTDKQWTIAIKKALIDVSEEYGLSTNCNLYSEEYSENENNEWLYDFIAYKWNDDIFDEVYLVCESEWAKNFNKIKEDFLKIIFTRSKVRLMIYQVSQDFYDEYKNNLINIIEKSKSCFKDDVYLFGIYNYTSYVFAIEKYIKKGN